MVRIRIGFQVGKFVVRIKNPAAYGNNKAEPRSKDPLKHQSGLVGVRASVAAKALHFLTASHGEALKEANQTPRRPVVL